MSATGNDAAGSRVHRPRRLVALARFRMFLLRTPPARLLVAGYLSYVLIGWGLLMLPVAQEHPVGAIDGLFIAASAISTTGLATVDTGTSFTFWGELVVLLLIQAGGLGYMTIGSFAYLSLSRRLSGLRVHTTRATFGLPSTISPAVFIRSVVLFTLFVEAAGAFALTVMFYHRGVPDFLWQAIFHSVSSFCTAGFSLFATSMEAYKADPAVLLTISALSILGSVGFLIVVDIWAWTVGRAARLGFTSIVILKMTAWLIGVGTVVVVIADPVIAAMPLGTRLLNGFFQAMTASTTVGFNTVPVGQMGIAALFALIVLMLIGASPAGTGGGFKTTSAAVLAALVRSTLRGRGQVQLYGQAISEDRVHLAASAFAHYLSAMSLALFALLIVDPGATFEATLFEAVSAMSTVGLSMGMTGSLSDAGKLIVTFLMFAGRVGFLTFGVAIALRNRTAVRLPETDLVL